MSVLRVKNGTAGVHRSNVKIGVCHMASDVRHTLAQRFISDGFKQTNVHESMQDIHHDLHTHDVLVMDMDREPDHSLQTLARLRRGEIGDNPFPIIIALLSNRQSNKIASLIDAGVDDIICLPSTIEQTMRRITSQWTARKQFVVTSCYVGPDRRTDDRDGQVPHFFMPLNPVADKMRGLPNEAYQIKVKHAFQELLRVQGNIQSRSIIELIRRLGAVSHDPVKIQKSMDMISASCTAALNAFRDNPSATALLSELNMIVGRVRSNATATSRDFRLLPFVGQALSMAIDPSSSGDQQTLGKITASLSQK